MRCSVANSRRPRTDRLRVNFKRFLAIQRSRGEVMRVSISVKAVASNASDGTKTVVPASLNGTKITGSDLDEYLDLSLVELGLSGGEVVVVGGRSSWFLRTDFWSPRHLTEAEQDQLIDFVCTQLEDGVGEGGFVVGSATSEVCLNGDLGTDIRYEEVDDGKPVPPPPVAAIAVQRGDVDALRREIARGVDLEARLQGYSALAIAIQTGNSDAAMALIHAGADVNACSTGGKSPLDLCAMSNNLSDDGSRKLALLLLDKGARPDYVGPDGRSAKDWATLRGKSATADELNASGRVVGS